MTVRSGEFPAVQAAGLNRLDSFVPARDLAMALALTSPLPEDLAQVALRTAQARFPGRPRGASFAPEVPARDGSTQGRDRPRSAGAGPAENRGRPA